MFLLNLGWKWTFAALDGLRGAIVLPSGNPVHRVLADGPGDFQVMLLDPQLYLAGLQVKHRAKICGRLACYPWFGVPDVEKISTTQGSRRELDAQIRALVVERWPGHPPADLGECALGAISFQVECGCTSIILPAPLVDAREDEGFQLGGLD
jgi:hypothetical protein